MEKALKLFQERHKEDASLLKKSLENWKPVKNPIGGEADFIALSPNLPESLYGTINISSQLRHWKSLLPLNRIKVLVVYGAGMGYPYQSLQGWLKGDPERRLYFLEDDYELAAQFLKSELGEVFMNDPQVDLRLVRQDPYAQQNFLKEFVGRFTFVPYFFTGIPSYQRSKSISFFTLKTDFEQFRYRWAATFGEELNLGREFFHNFWQNIGHLDHSKLFSKLEGSFEKVPAIVVGAGPSLYKQIPLLKALQDKALIISGGTAVNVLNSHGITPHLIIGLDPFEGGTSRALAYTSFETPLIYMLRYNTHAMNFLSGPLIYLDGGTSFQAEMWARNEKKLADRFFPLGTNVINAALVLADYLGCDPLIAVGVDLAYTNNEAYGAGIHNHAIFPNEFRSRSAPQQTSDFTDIYGKPIKTLTKWITESMWYSGFKREHPHKTFVNATEGGIGFSNVENVTLKEVAGKWLNKPQNIKERLKLALEKASFPEGAPQARELVERLYESLENLNRTFQALQDKNPQLLDSFDLDSEEVAAFLETIEEELAWKAIVIQFNGAWTRFISGLDESQKSIKETYVKVEGRLKFLWSAVQFNLPLAKQALEFLSKEKNRLPPKPPEVSYKDGELDGVVKLFWPDGSLKRLLEFSQGEQTGKDTFWTPEGVRVFEANYKDGHPAGSSYIFSDKGDLIKEFLYDEEGKHLEDKFGEQFQRFEHNSKDYFEKVGSHSKPFSDSMEKVIRTLKEAIPNPSEKDVKELEVLAQEMERLKGLQEELSSFHKEKNIDIRTGSVDEMEDEVNAAVKQLKDLSKRLELQVKNVRKKLGDK